MDIKRWEALIVSVEKGSFTAAAEVLGYTQSGLTHMMNRLERDVGYPLLTRGRDGIKLTPLGEELMPQIRALLRANDRLTERVYEIEQLKNGVIRIGTYASMAQHWLPKITRSFQEKYPNVQIEINCCTMQDTYDLVSDGRLDLSLTSFRTGSSLEWTHLAYDRFCAVLPPDYNCEGMESFPISKYGGEKFLMPSCGFDYDVLPLFESCNITPSIQLTSVDDPTVISMIAHGLGVSLMSDLMLKDQSDGVITLPLEPYSVRELGILSQPVKRQNKVVREFIVSVEQTVKSL